MKTTCKLRSFETYSDFCFVDFNPERMEISCHRTIGDSDIQQSGFYYSDDNAVLGFFFVENCWLFFFGNEAFKVDEIADLKRHYHGTGGASISIALKNGKSLKADYIVGNKIANDPTPFVEDEDFDFGLFFQNVVLDKDRLQRIVDCQQS